MPTKKGERVKKVKRIVFDGLLIFRSGWDTPWSKEIFLSEEYAKSYFGSYCTKHNFDFEWSDYVLIKCKTSYQKPRLCPPTPKIRNKKTKR